MYFSKRQILEILKTFILTTNCIKYLNLKLSSIAFDSEVSTVCITLKLKFSERQIKTLANIQFSIKSFASVSLSLCVRLMLCLCFLLANLHAEFKPNIPFINLIILKLKLINMIYLVFNLVKLCGISIHFGKLWLLQIFCVHSYVIKLIKYEKNKLF